MKCMSLFDLPADAAKSLASVMLQLEGILINVINMVWYIILSKVDNIFLILGYSFKQVKKHKDDDKLEKLRIRGRKSGQGPAHFIRKLEEAVS